MRAPTGNPVSTVYTCSFGFFDAFLRSEASNFEEAKLLTFASVKLEASLSQKRTFQGGGALVLLEQTGSSACYKLITNVESKGVTKLLLKKRSLHDCILYMSSIM